MDADARFLVAHGVGALNTVNAVRPVARSGPLSPLSFFSGWLTSELPLHTVGVQALATAGHVARHGMRSPRTMAGVALGAASWAALVGVHRQAAAAGEVFDAALETGLGADWSAPVDERPLPGRGQGLVSERSIRRLRRRYLVASDLSYGPAGSRNHLDVWRAPDTPDTGTAPVLLQIHGGGWMTGNKEEQGAPLMAHMVERGWVCVAINYRLSPRSTWPDHIVDVKRAIAWIKANIAEHGGDPRRLAVTGGSAGGHLSALAALTPDVPEFQPGFEDADTAVQAAVPFYGVYDFVNRDGTGRDDQDPVLARWMFKATKREARRTWERASPRSWLRADAPPFMVIHGTNDSLAPVEQGRSFATALRSRSDQPVVYAELPGAQHAFEVFDSVRTRHAVRAVGRFLDHTVAHPA